MFPISARAWVIRELFKPTLQEEQKKREQRAAKYGKTLLGLNGEEIEKAEKMKKRLEKFGPVEPPTDSMGMELGADILRSILRVILGIRNKHLTSHPT
jgi:hypothetical protein